MNDIDFATEELAEALRDADLGRAHHEATRLKDAIVRDDHVSRESFCDLVHAVQELLGRIAGASPGAFQSPSAVTEMVLQ